MVGMWRAEHASPYDCPHFQWPWPLQATKAGSWLAHGPHPGPSALSSSLQHLEVRRHALAQVPGRAYATRILLRAGWTLLVAVHARCH